MKIYQLHKRGGEWEDSYDYIVGSYLRKERAEEEKIKAEAKEKEKVEHGRKCGNCPFLDGALLSRYPDYCSEAKLEEGEYGMRCDNYYLHWYEDTFSIKEIEVEE